MRLWPSSIRCDVASSPPRDIVDHDARQPVVPRVDEHARDRFGCAAARSLRRVGSGRRRAGRQSGGRGRETECACSAIRRLDVVEREVVRRGGERGHDAAHVARSARPPSRTGTRHRSRVFGCSERFCATELGRYSSASIASSTFARVAGRTFPRSLTTRETVAMPDARPGRDIRDPCLAAIPNRFHALTFCRRPPSKSSGESLDLPGTAPLRSPPTLKALPRTPFATRPAWTNSGPAAFCGR